MKKRGQISILTLLVASLFLILLAGLLSFILMQLKLSKQRVAWQKALHLAEAGIEYYKWCLNNGIEELCEKEKDFTDAKGNVIGHFSLQITSKTICGQTIQREIVSLGYLKDFPELKRKIKVLYARESVGKYAYLINDNVWAGSDREIRGLYHSNGGIRMDGTNYSLVTSARENWLCTSSFGCLAWNCPQECTPQGGACNCPGIFGKGENSDLWQWPVLAFDFEGITIDLAQMKKISQENPEALYLPPSSQIHPSGKGYHLIFNSDGTLQIKIITSLSPTLAYSLEEGWHYDYFIISSEYLYHTYSLPSSCPLIFVEDDLWIEGTLKGKVMVASANLIDPNKDTNVVLPDNLNYTQFDGSDGLALLGEKNILIGPQSPENMILRGIFIAQKGRFGRNHYPGNIKDSLLIVGSIVSNKRVGTQWISWGQVVSGYLKRENYFDPNLVYSPPPFVPYVTHQFEIVNWQEIR